MSMKIDFTNHLIKTPPDPVAKKTPAGSGGAFTDILGSALKGDAVGPATTPDAAQRLSAPPGPVSISGVQFSRLPVAPPANAAEQVDRLLNLLEGYQRELADPDRSLKTIAPRLAQVEKGTRELEKSIESLEDGDSLKSIAQEALVTATAEVFKFNRGDYNPS